MVAPRGALPDPDDTIIALSSAPGPAARAIVRLSGPRSTAIAAALVPGFARLPRQVFTGALILPDLYSPLPTDVYFFAAPKTYTGQDVIELHTLGSPPLVELLIAACLNAGARAAGPGEFTMRAFLAGKLDLTRAEAVLGVIEAGTRAELQQALAQLAGGLAQPLQTLRDDLLNLLADVEAGLDFADEDLSFVQVDDLLRRLGAGLAHLLNLRRQLDGRATADRPYRVIMAGPPNAGKSSLFNALAGRDAALVSPTPGTTRDYLEATITVGDVRLQLVDTAGLRAATDAIEADAQALGQEQTGRADLVLLCQPCDEPAEFSWPATSPPCAKVATKSDLGIPSTDAHATSVTTNAGIEDLRQLLAARARHKPAAPLAPSLSRCRHHVDACLTYLRQAHRYVVDEGPPELLALELRLVLEELGVMVGAVYTDDLLDRIFSRFCIGK